MAKLQLYRLREREKSVRVYIVADQADSIERHANCPVLEAKRRVYNGAPLGRAWIRHAQIKDGAVLRFSFSDVDTGFGRNTPPPGAMD